MSIENPTFDELTLEQKAYIALDACYFIFANIGQEKIMEIFGEKDDNFLILSAAQFTLIKQVLKELDILYKQFCETHPSIGVSITEKGIQNFKNFIHE